MKKRITIELSNEIVKTLSIEAIEQGTKLKLMIEDIVSKKSKHISNLRNENRDI